MAILIIALLLIAAAALLMPKRLDDAEASRLKSWMDEHAYKFRAGPPPQK